MPSAITESVPPSRQLAAMRFLIGGSSRDAIAELQAHGLYQRTFAQDPQAASLWWTRRWRKPLAAAMVYRNVGKTGTLFASPPTAPGVDRSLLPPLIHQLSESEIRAGLSMVQAVLPPEAVAEVEVLLEAGFHRLATLVYMHLDLSTVGATPPLPAGISFRRFDEFAPHELEDVIRRSYQQSLDCPALEGVREMSDVVAGHRASGLFSPDSWWIAIVKRQPAGCVLVNESLGGDESEVVYLGVAPEFRGRGIGKALLWRAIEHVRFTPTRRLSLAADASNVPAISLYEKVGFRAHHRREAVILTRKDLPG